MLTLTDAADHMSASRLHDEGGKFVALERDLEEFGRHFTTRDHPYIGHGDSRFGRKIALFIKLEESDPDSTANEVAECQ
jgi:hypothetical protein